MRTIDRTFTALLTFGTLVCGTLAIGAAMLEGDRAMHAAHPVHATAVHVIMPERVVVTARRAASAATLAQGDTGGTPTLR